MSSYNIIPKSPVSLNGDRPHSPSPYTTPALLASVEELREDLVLLAAGIEHVLAHVDEAALFLDHRVEQARVPTRPAPQQERVRMTAVTIVVGRTPQTIDLVDLEGALRRALHTGDQIERTEAHELALPTRHSDDSQEPEP